MKKILTASLVAMMAVTTANAEIASTTYVDDRTGDVANSTYVKSLAEGKRNLASAVDALAANMGDGGSVETQIDSKIETFQEDVIGDLGDSTDVADAIADAQTAAEGKVTALANGQVTTNKNDIANLKTSKLDVSTYNADKPTFELKANKLNATDSLVKTNQTDDKFMSAAGTMAAINQAKNELTTGTDQSISAINTTLNQVKTLAEGNETAIGTLTNTVNTNKTAAENALNTYKTQAAETFMDSAEVSAAITAAVTNPESGALKNYSTTEQMNTAIANANNTQTTTITNAYKAADTALETSLKKYSDDKDTAQTTALQGYADTAEADAISTAEDFTLAEIAKIVNAADMTDGTKVLTLKVSGDTKTLGWETIGR